MAGYELVAIENLCPAMGCLEPEGFPAKGKGCRVEAVLEAEVAVPVQFSLSPLYALRRPVWQRLKDMAFGFGKHAQRPLLGSAVDAVARFTQDPFFGLIVGIDQGAEVPQREKSPFEGLDS